MEEIIAQRYKLLKPLGRGSFGNVYLAEDLNSDFERHVVVKLSSEVPDPGDREVFRREALLSAELLHPSIAGIYHYGINDDGRLYIVREYVKGDSLEVLLAQVGKLDIRDALAVAASIAEGLKAAHDLGIIHRDIKPSNIIIPTHGTVREYDRAKITDFGVFGKLLGKRGGNEGVTMPGELYGTPQYMAPEQLRAESQTTATDIYELGMVLYEMVYGLLPFPSGSIVEMMRAKVYGRIDYPFEPTVSSGLVALLRECLQTEPKDRIQTANILILRLRDLRRSYQAADPAVTDSVAVQRQHIDENLVIGGPAIPVSAVPVEAMWPHGYESQVQKGFPLLKTLIVAAAVIVLIPGLGTILWFLWQLGMLNWGTLIGVALVLLGVCAAFGIGKLVKSKQTEIGRDAQDVLFGTKSRDWMTRSLAIQVDVLLSKITQEDDKILGMSLALMVREFAEAKEGEGGQALVNLVTMLEKISARLSPWYVRHDKLVATMVAVVGILSGITTVTVTVISAMKSK